MRTIILAAILFVFWGAFYTLLTVLKNEIFILSAFAFTLIVSMITASVYLVKVNRD